MCYQKVQGTQALEVNYDVVKMLVIEEWCWQVLNSTLGLAKLQHMTPGFRKLCFALQVKLIPDSSDPLIQDTLGSLNKKRRECWHVATTINFMGEIVCSFHGDQAEFPISWWEKTATVLCAECSQSSWGILSPAPFSRLRSNETQESSCKSITGV